MPAKPRHPIRVSVSTSLHVSCVGAHLCAAVEAQHKIGDILKIGGTHKIDGHRETVRIT